MPLLVNCAGYSDFFIQLSSKNIAHSKKIDTFALAFDCIAP